MEKGGKRPRLGGLCAVQFTSSSGGEEGAEISRKEAASEGASGLSRVQHDLGRGALLAPGSASTSHRIVTSGLTQGATGRAEVGGAGVVAKLVLLALCHGQGRGWVGGCHCKLVLLPQRHAVGRAGLSGYGGREEARAVYRAVRAG